VLVFKVLFLGCKNGLGRGDGMINTLRKKTKRERDALKTLKSKQEVQDIKWKKYWWKDTTKPSSVGIRECTTRALQSRLPVNFFHSLEKNVSKFLWSSMNRKFWHKIKVLFSNYVWCRLALIKKIFVASAATPGFYPSILCRVYRFFMFKLEILHGNRTWHDPSCANFQNFESL